MSFRILSIDGGGTRGIIPARMLDCIEQATGTPVQHQFDLFAGTSTGGLICLGLAIGLRPTDLVSGNWGNIQWIRYLPDLLTEGKNSDGFDRPNNAAGYDYICG